MPASCTIAGTSPLASNATASISARRVRNRRRRRRHGAMHRSGRRFPVSGVSRLAAVPTPTPPHRAAPTRTVLSEHGDERVDDWYWLRERDDPDVLAHLEAENAYADAMLAPTTRAAGPDLRGDQGTHAGDRHVGADARRSVGVLHAHGRRDSSTRSIAGGRAAQTPTAANSPARRERRAPMATTTSRSAASRSPPTTASLAYSVDTTGGERLHACGSATSHTGATSPTSSRRHLRPRVGRRRAHVLLRPPRRRDAAVAGVAPRARDRARRRRARVPRKTTIGSTRRCTGRASGRFVADRRPRRRPTSEVWFVPTATPSRGPRVVAAAVARPRVLGGAPLRRRSTATGSSSSRTAR